MKIFGIGLPKTGNHSLVEAMRILGYSAKNFPERDQEIEDNDFSCGKQLANKHAHETDVHRYFSERPADLLSIDIVHGAGWERLCPFLNHSVLGQAFPKRNVTSQLPGEADAAASGDGIPTQ